MTFSSGPELVSLPLPKRALREGKIALTQKEKSARYQAKHPDRTAENTRRWRSAHPEHKAAASEYSKAYRAAHPEYKERQRIAATEFRKANPEKVSIRNRRYSLKNTYQITPADYDKLVAIANGLCMICGNPPTSKGNGQILHIDHNHITGAVRGLLCALCNKMIGLGQDDPERLRMAADYLERNM